MGPNDHESPGLGTLAGRLAQTALGALKNRAELFTLELQQEKARRTELIAWSGVLIFFGMLTTLLLTATIIFLFPEELRVYVAAAFILLYLGATLLAGFTIRELLKDKPFSESIEQVKKDRVWLDSLK
jgi:uncharacterized membrane protein YqjE